jgi:hypothetical protein
MSNVISLQEFLALDRPTVRWLVPDLIPQPGIVVLIGSPKVGKSFFALQVAMQLAEGSAILGHTPTAPARTLYLQLDTSELVWRDRLTKLTACGYTLHDNVKMPHPDYLKPPAIVTDVTVQQRIQGMLNDVQPNLVIVDVMRKIHQFNENDSTAMKLLNDILAMLFGQYALLLIHHGKKPLETDMPSDDMESNIVSESRGSTEITGNADALWRLRRRSLTIVSRFSESVTYNAERTKAGLWQFTKQDDSQTAAPVDERRHMVQQLIAANPKLPLSQIFDIHGTRLTSHGIGRTTFYKLAALPDEA